MTDEYIPFSRKMVEGSFNRAKSGLPYFLRKERITRGELERR
jgi:hypothetical protein